MNLSSFTQLTGFVSRSALLALAVTSAGVGQAKEQWHVYDVLGNTVASVNADAVVAEIESTAFGESRTPTAGARFTGKPYDADLGAHVFPFRNYRSDSGRWTSADPSGFPDGVNGMGYAPVPVLACDPYGLETKWEIVSAGDIWIDTGTPYWGDWITGLTMGDYQFQHRDQFQDQWLYSAIGDRQYVRDEPVYVWTAFAVGSGSVIATATFITASAASTGGAAIIVGLGWAVGQYTYNVVSEMSNSWTPVGPIQNKRSNEVPYSGPGTTQSIVVNTEFRTIE